MSNVVQFTREFKGTYRDALYVITASPTGYEYGFLLVVSGTPLAIHGHADSHDACLKELQHRVDNILMGANGPYVRNIHDSNNAG